MYTIFLALHNLMRWPVLLVGLVALVGIIRWARGRGLEGWPRQSLRAWIITWDVQLLLGLILLALSPHFRAGSSWFQAARPWLMDHVVPMVIGLVLAHMGNTMVRRSEDDPCWCRAWPLFLAWLLALAVTPWATRPLFPRLP